MSVIYGYSEAEERIKNENMEPIKMVHLDHDFYTNNHLAADKKIKEVHKDRYDHNGDDIGFKGKEVRNKFAMGGPVKERRGFFE